LELLREELNQLFHSTPPQPIDLLTVSAQLKRNGKLEMAGSDFYLIQLTQKIASSAHIVFHARIILQKFIQRSLITISSKLIEDCYDEDILSAAIEEILRIGNRENKVNLLAWINFSSKENKSALFLFHNLNIEGCVIELLEKENDAETEILYLSIFYLYWIGAFGWGRLSEDKDYENMMWEFTLFNLFNPENLAKENLAKENLAIVGNHFHKMIPILGQINRNIIEDTFALLFTYNVELDNEVLTDTLNAMSEVDSFDEGFSWCEDKDLILEALIYLKNSYDDDDLIRLIKSLM
jgi:hypothetical protein